MSFPRAIEWEVRGLVLVSGKWMDSPLGTGIGRTEQEAIAHWRQRRPEWRDKASCIHAIPAPVFRTRPLLLVAVCVLAASASLAGFAEPAVGPSWASDERNTRVDDTPRPQASVGAGNALVGCVQSTLEAPDSAQAGGRPALIFGDVTICRGSLPRCGSGAVADLLAGHPARWSEAAAREQTISTQGAPRESLRTPHCPPVRT